MARSRKGKAAAFAREVVCQCAANNANSLRHSDTKQKSSSTINKMLASSDVYIVAHKLTRRAKAQNVSLTPLLPTTSDPDHYHFKSFNYSVIRFPMIPVTPRTASCGLYCALLFSCIRPSRSSTGANN